jgi:cation-transporting ATPase E
MTSLTGLTSEEAAARYAAGQHNRPPEPGTKSIREIWISNLFSVFNLVIGGIIVFLLAFWIGSGDIRLLADGAGIFSVASLNTIIAVMQEIRAKRAMDKVNMLLVREVTVIRDGREQPIRHGDIVLGDLVLLRRGDQAVVDGPVASSNHLEMDESLLTGESEPIEKREGETILSGSFCVSGMGHYTVERLADASFASQVTRVARKMKAHISPLQRNINRIVELLFGVAVALCILQTAMEFRHGHPDIDFVRRVATVIMGLVPQGLVLTSSVIFAIGIYRISKVGAVVQRFNAIESFSAVRVICMDKTGTLTQNRMTVREVTAIGIDRDLLRRLLGTYARLATDKNATNRALEELPFEDGATLVRDVPFSSQRKTSMVTMSREGREQTYVLGAYEIVAERCALPPDFIETHRLDVYRNLLFGLSTEAGVEPLGVVSLSDTVRNDVKDVLERFANSGIQFKILSGDSAVSIMATCRDIGWHPPAGGVITGAELDALGESEFQDAVTRAVVFARLRPEHKVRIVSALRARGLHTAMIGDGVNDVPAIKQADLGIAMEEGAAITREVADIVLCKNRFTLLPQVYEEGNRIVNTVSSVAKLFLTKNFLVIYLTLAAALFMLEFPLTPRRVSLFNIFAIGIPAMVIAFSNTNTARVLRFFVELISYVAVSALAMAVFTYLSRDPMVMVSIMVLTSIANFLVVGGRSLKYLAVASAMIAVYALAVTITGDGWLLRFIHVYYEIAPMKPSDLWTAAEYGAAAAAALAIAQWVRARLVR